VGASRGGAPSFGRGDVPATFERRACDLLGAALDRVERGPAQQRWDLPDDPLRQTQDPELQRYSTIPYRNTTHPAISIWELRGGIKYANRRACPV
jgi:hypothetical protein